MKNIGIPHQYACFACRKSFKRKQFSNSFNRFMTSRQQSRQRQKIVEFNAARVYKCPECGGKTYFMGLDFKAPKKSDTKAWHEVEMFIKSGKVYYRGSQSDG